MYLIMVYDIREERVYKVLKTARKYLTWVQNSVLEGEITEAGFERLKMELREIIKEEEDSVIFYTMRTTRYTSRENMGVVKGGEEQII
ncbi:MAG: CRISPR-associated endonuclease Cas2 [Candidatus Thermoplasmatota archaeon]|nr:CRISPR-associated endonuclease Cas2 [Candidatus Thermoplasmatota archaeon]